MRVFRCFSFVDMCGFTRMNDTLGDDEALAVLAEFRAIVRGLSPDHGIRVGKWLGDAFPVFPLGERQIPGIITPVSVWRVASTPEVEDDLPLSFAE